MIAHIIHNRARADRMALLQHEIAVQDLLPVFWPAVMADKPCTGISMAHKQIIRYAKEQHLPAVLVMEDDVAFTAAGAFDFFRANIPEDYDLYLGGVYYVELASPPALSSRRGSQEPVQQVPVRGDTNQCGGIVGDNTNNGDGFFTAHAFSGLHCYVCHERFYDTFLAADEGVDIDQALWGKGKFVVCSPMVAVQHSGMSDNAGKVVDYSDRLDGWALYGHSI